MTTIGDRVYKLRRERDWSREKLGELAGIGRMTVYSLEEGRRMPSYTTLERIAIAFDMTMDKLYEGVGEPDGS